MWGRYTIFQMASGLLWEKAKRLAKGAEMRVKETEDRERLDLQRFGSIRS